VNKPWVVKKVDFLSFRLKILPIRHVIVVFWEASLVHVGDQVHLINFMVTA
jgi:hypothetical protein